MRSVVSCCSLVNLCYTDTKLTLIPKVNISINKSFIISDTLKYPVKHLRLSHTQLYQMHLDFVLAFRQGEDTHTNVTPRYADSCF